jgi:hypothetical protein
MLTGDRDKDCAEYQRLAAHEIACADRAFADGRDQAGYLAMRAPLRYLDFAALLRAAA